MSGAALRALSHPLRVEIIDVLGQRGPQTASTLGRLVGESSGATSYHLRALAKHGIVVEIPGRGSARERWWDVAPDGLRLNTPAASESPANRAAAEIVTMEIFRRRNEHLMDFLRTSLRSDPDISRRDATLISSTFRLTQEQFETLRDELNSLVEHAKAMEDANGENVGRLYAVNTDVFPLGDRENPDTAAHTSARHKTGPHDTEEQKP